MDLFTYLMAKNNQNTHKDLFSYLLGKGSGGGGTYTTYTGTSLNISNTIKAKIKNFILNSTELTQDGTPSPSSPVDVNVIKGENNVKVENKNLLNIANYNGSINNLNIVSANQQITIDGIANSGTYTWIVITKDNFFARNGTPSASAIVDYANGKIISTGIVSKLKEVISGTSTVDFGINLYNENGAAVSAPIETTKIIAVGIYLGNGQTFNNYKFGIQLEQNAAATEYIEHQEQNYPISLSSKNLALNDDTNNPDVNYENSGAGSVAIQYGTTEQGFYTTTSRARFFKLEEGKTYVFSVYGKYRTTGNAHYIYYYYFNSTTEEATAVQGSISISQSDNYNRYSKTFTIPSGYDGFKIIVFNGLYFKDIQLEEGSTATEYEPYYNIEYCKIGDYADQIFKNTTNSPYYDSTLLENEWYLKKKVLKVDSYNGETITTPFISTTGGLDTGATIYYGLTTPTYIHISESDYSTLKGQLDNLYNNAESYDGQTNITQTNDDLPFNISVDVKVTSANLSMSNSLNTPLNLDNTNEDEIEEQNDEPTEEEVS